MKSIFLTINNSKESAIRTGKWKNPGSSLYDKLLLSSDSRYQYNGRNVFPEDEESKTWNYWQDFIKETYLIAPVKDIKNNPHEKTPFSRSGCKYPHHVIKKKDEYTYELVVSIPALKAAYLRACQENIMIGEVKEHLERHIKELGIEASFHNGELSWNESYEIKIEENFNFIYDYIQENTGIDLHDEYMTEASHGKLKYDFRFGWDYNTGHQVKIVYSLDNIEVTGVGDFYWKYNKDNRNADGSLKMDENQYKDWVSKNITRKGNNDHQSKGQKVLSIIDLVNNQKLNSVKLMSPIALDDYEYKFTHYTAIPKNILPKARKIAEDGKGIQLINVGEIDNTPTFKSTTWFTKVIDRTTGENLRFNKLAKAEFIKIGRGIKPDDIQAKKIEIHDDPDLRPLIYDNPNKKEALNELYGIERNTVYFIKLFKYAIQNNEYPQGWDYNRTTQILDQYMNKLKYIQHDIDTIKSGKYNLSMMKKYKEASMIESAEEDRSEYIANTMHVDYIPPTQSIPYYTIPFSYDGISESTEAILEDVINDILDQGGVTPQEVFEWIRSNISYDKASPSEWKLKSPQETYDLKKGNCHDQSLLTFTLFKSMGLKRGQLFFIEYKEGEEVGGNTHTLTWYRDKDDSKKYYWFETAWETQAGIHGPYSSIDDMKKDIHNKWKNEFGKHWDDIEFSETPRYKVGMGLGDYVDSWVFVEDIKEAMDWIDNFVNDEYFRDSLTCKNLIMESDSEYSSIFIPIYKIESNISEDDNDCIDYWIYGEDKKTKAGAARVNTKTRYGSMVISFEKYHHQGYMEYLLSYLIKYAGLRHLLVLIDNTPAINLYKKIGFQISKTITRNNALNNEPEYFYLMDIDDKTAMEMNVQGRIIDTSNENSIQKSFDNNIFIEGAVIKNSKENITEEKPISRPKQTDAAEKDKNGVRRKKLYIAFIEWCKEYNNKNTFGSLFDKDVFNVTYPFVPKEMRYFYRLANPMLCVLGGNLTFFPVAELKKLNSKNKRLSEMMIFAATETDMRVFNNKDKKVYLATEENSDIKLSEVLADSFDMYIQIMIDKGDILNGPIESETNNEE